MTCNCPPKTPATFCKCCGCVNNPHGQGLRANGDPCRMAVVPGTHKCHMHGGSTPQALLKAQQAAALLRMPVLESMHEVHETMMEVIRQFAANQCPTCGYPKGDVEEIQAVAKVASVCINQARMILDRTGIPPKAVLEVKQVDGDLDLRQLTAGEKQRMISLLAEMRDLKEDIRRRIHGVPVSVIETQALPGDAE